MDWSDLQNWNEYTKIFIALIARLSPPFVMTLFVNVAGERPFREKLGVALVGSFTFAVVMIFFIFIGEALLETFGITMAAFRIAGGFLLFLLAIDMIRSEGTKPDAENHAGESWLVLGIVPIGMPVLAGPGMITTIVIFAEAHEGTAHQLLVSGVVLGVTACVLAMLVAAAAAGRLFRPAAIKVFNRVMGLIVLAIAVEFILDGFAAHFPSLASLH